MLGVEFVKAYFYLEISIKRLDLIKVTMKNSGKSKEISAHWDDSSSLSNFAARFQKLFILFFCSTHYLTSEREVNKQNQTISAFVNFAMNEFAIFWTFRGLPILGPKIVALIKIYILFFVFKFTAYEHFVNSCGASCVFWINSVWTW